MATIVVLAILLALAVAIAGYFYYQYRNSAPVKDVEEITKLTEEIGAVMVLPEGETPTLATVTDREKLAEQPFFQKAENGDKVLIYTNNGRAILYRPSTKKIVDVTTVNVNTPTPPAAETPAVPVAAPQSETTAQPEAAASAVPVIVRVALLNGSAVVGATNTKEKQLTAAYRNIAVVSKEAAKKDDYEKTVVVDIAGTNAEMAGKIADTLGATISSLPEGEVVPPDADILVIVGKE